tara:strand:- start:220 stop:789 length:570 start_codon:yes stop_codon:yes gene_type:complete
MIYIKDDFLPVELLNNINNDKNPFNEVKTPGKSFWVKKPSEDFIKFITKKISEIEGCYIENILCFFREAKQNQDNDWRIHNDSIIEGKQPDRALVLYLSENNNKLNGTAFWTHKEYGDIYKQKGIKKFNKLLKEDSNDISKWNLNTVIGHKPNRLISYPCNYFHSKYPNEFLNSRKVLVMFYKQLNERK